MSNNAPTIVIIAGETSGDTLGAHLAAAIKQQQPHATLIGFGGDQMQRAGVDIRMHCKELAIVGIIEAIKKWRVIRRAFQCVRTIFETQQPQLVILIDYPGFNLRVAKQAKQANAKVFYYTSPQIWAWKYHRIKTIRANVDHMAVLFPFEETLYQREHVPVTFVGHPLTQRVQPSMSKDDAKRHFKLNPKAPVIGLFPGSRQQEINALLTVIIDTIPLVAEHIPEAQWVLPLAPNLDRVSIQSRLPNTVTVVQDNLYNAMQVCDAAIAVSGTITLELALMQIPTTIIYRTHWLTYLIAKRVVKTLWIGLCNIIAEQEVAKEWIQQQANPHNIANEVRCLLHNQTYRTHRLDQLQHIQQQLGNTMSNTAIAQLALGLIEQPLTNSSPSNTVATDNLT